MPAPSVKEILEEFSALIEFIASGEKPSARDRQMGIEIWGKMVDKMVTGPITYISEFEGERRWRLNAMPQEDKDGKLRLLWRMEAEAEQAMEAETEGTMQKYTSAKRVIERFNLCIAFLEKWLSETEPDRQTIVTMDPLALKAVMSGTSPAPQKEDTATDEPRPKPPRGRKPKSAPTEEEAVSEGGDAPANPGAPAGSAQSDPSFTPKAPEDVPEEPVAPAAKAERPRSTFQQLMDRE